MKTVLDTSVLIAQDVAPIEGAIAISAVSVAELQSGVLVAGDPATRAERLRRLSILQRRFDALPVDDSVAHSYGLLAAAVVSVDRNPRARSLDLLIAATAHAHESRLCTRNPADFRGVEDLVEILHA